MEQLWLNSILFLFILLIVYFFIRNYDTREGLELLGDDKSTLDTKKEGSTTPGSSSNGVAGNASTYLIKLKDINMKASDILNITKYRKDYEDIILTMDDTLSYTILQTILKIDASQPEKGMMQLAQLNEVRSSLNNALKFVDKQ
jgi:hypothetical protein